MISRKRALRALETLLEKGLITPDQERGYMGMVKEGVSAKGLLISELGKVTGELYVAEEQAQVYILHGLKIDLSKTSVPEVLLVEDDMSIEPWHKERYSEKKAHEKFREEAGEPWHPSLLERFRPDPAIQAYFRHYPGIASYTDRILKMAYGTR